MNVFVYPLSEFGIIALFTWCFFAAWRAEEPRVASASTRAPSPLRGVAVLISAALFAALFENLNVLQVRGRGSYSYSDGFALNVFVVPLFIVLAWAIILWAARVLAGQTPRDANAHTVFQLACRDAFFAVLLDLSFDVVAIRFGFWSWHGVALNEAWFGVPAGNFFGWLFVSLAFSFLSRMLDARAFRRASTREWRQIFLLPPAAFVLYRAVEFLCNALLRALHLTSDFASLAAFFALFLIIGIIATCASTRVEESEIASRKVAEISRAAFHTFALVGLFLLPPNELLAAQRPALLGIAAALAFFDFWLLKQLRC